MSGSDEGFLSRWSRLKREPEPDKPEASADAPPSPAADLARSVEEIVAALPRIEDLLPGQSLSGFMQAGVPVDLKNAALRRMWSIDPAIRDFVGEALDYAYDYNTPGAAPGFGPMVTSSEQVNEVLAMFDKALPQGVDSLAKGPPDNLPHQSDVPRNVDPDNVALQHSTGRDEPLYGVAAEGAAEPSSEPAPALDSGLGAGQAVSVALRDTPAKTNALTPKLRRHGSALPH